MNDRTPTEEAPDDDPTGDAAPRPSPFEFRPDPRNPNRLAWSSPRGPARLALARAVVFFLGALTFGLGAPVMLATSPDFDLLDRVVLVALLAVLAACIAALAVHYAFDARGRGRNVIVLHPRHLEFDLAAHRSLTEETPRAAGRVYYNEIAFLETRVEIYRVFGLPLRQCKFRLVTDDGEPLLLFEDRRWSTDPEASHARLAAAIAARARVPMRDRGIVEGESGLLGIVGARAPKWAVRGER